MSWWTWVIEVVVVAAWLVWMLGRQRRAMLAAWQKQIDHGWAVKQREYAGVMKTLTAQRATLDEALRLLHDCPVQFGDLITDEEVVRLAFCEAHPLPEAKEKTV